MQITCLVSHNPGHLDFGGEGFLRLAQRLQDRGHRVTWMAGRTTSRALHRRGQEVERVLSTEELTGAALLRATGDQWAASCEAIRRWRKALRVSGPQILLVDRCLATAGPIAESLQLPLVAIGTPGGVWVRSGNGMWPSPHATMDTALDVSRRLAAEMNWLDSLIESEWLVSGSLNVSFLGRSFYPAEIVQEGSVFVDLFDRHEPRSPADANRLGFAFGHTGDIDRLRRVLDRVLHEGVFPPAEIDLFLGGRPGEAQRFLRYQELGATAHGWRDYREAFSRLAALVTFGGIGTLWHAIDGDVPVLVVPGGAGDQGFNGAAMARLGLGRVLEGDATEELSSLPGWEERHASFVTFKDPANFTDTLDTLCDRIERLSL